MMKVLKIILRLIVLPAVMLITGVHLLRLWAGMIIDFVVYGGELITYSEHWNQKTIADVYKKVSESEFIATE